MSFNTPARHYHPGMGQAVADRTINRKKPDGTIEEWADVAYRVAVGSSVLETRGASHAAAEFQSMHHHLRQASLLMSGRHLQHGDGSQATKNQELFTNCSTSATSFLLFYLLLNGSGVGRAYDDAMMQVDYARCMPTVIPALNWDHEDVRRGIVTGFETRANAERFNRRRKTTVYEVPDSREGWAKAVEIIERMTFEGRYAEVLILDFSKVRPKGSPIKGMQDRPASGPGPLMSAIANVARLRDSSMAPWEAAMWADHFLAECVLVGGARRAARMATKHWKDPTIFDFIRVKQGGFLWSSNNSVTVDSEFRAAVERVHGLISAKARSNDVAMRLEISDLLTGGQISLTEHHAYGVLRALAHAAYHDGTGEPGLINQDRLVKNDAGLDKFIDGEIARSAKFQLDSETLPLMQALVKACRDLGYPMITNPCGEICLMMLGAYCVIADVVPFHAANDDDAEDAFRTAVRALIRTNTMDCLYRREVDRTNRIGVGMTGFHEWAYARFGFAWRDLIDEEKSKALWLTVARFKRAIDDEAARYAAELGVVTPHTNTTFKPAGTTSKLFGLTEGAHLPSMREYLRWVQFRNDDPLVQDYAARGYPIKKLKVYEGTTVVGFPTRPTICDLDGGEWVVTAAEATPEEQYQFLRLLEKYWLRGVEADGVTPLATDTGNQISYTLKYDPKKVEYASFLDTLIDGQFGIKCCSVMPQTDTSAYEYQPEQPLTKREFEMVASEIVDTASEDIGFEHVDCGAGGCPIDLNEKVAA